MRLKIEGVEFNYQSQSVLKGINLELKQGEILGLVGPNGSGKSTLLKCVNRILEPQIGSVLINKTDLKSYSSQELAKCVGYVPQEETKKFPTTVFDTILMGRKPYINWKPKNNDLQVVSEIIDTLNLNQLAMQDINQLSGGQQQKVLIGRALAQDPDILLLDEPTSDLDLKHQLEILNIIKEQSNQGISAVIAMHDLSLAGRYSDQIVMLDEGAIFAAGGLEVLTSKNIQEVYQVEVSITKHNDNLLIVPEKPL
ncbi:ABC transporter ATP-binding protein [Halanaerobaculum tunisiense]